MDDASSLEEEFEQDLLLEPPEPPLASTPRQRLEDARAMADGNCDVTLGGDGGFPVPGIDDGDGEEPDTSTHLLQVGYILYESLVSAYSSISRRSVVIWLATGVVSSDQRGDSRGMLHPNESCCRLEPRNRVKMEVWV